MINYRQFFFKNLIENIKITYMILFDNIIENNIMFFQNTADPANL
jgi:hypothetical protein